MKKIHLRSCIFLFSCVTFLAIHLLSIAPSQAHWADLATADITIDQSSTQMILTVPTGLLAGADTDRNGTLSSIEIDKNQAVLQKLLGDKIRLTNDRNQSGTLQIFAAVPASFSSNTDRSTIKLDYSWSSPIEGVTINYALFAPDAPASRCIATLHHAKITKNIIFSPTNPIATSFPNSPLDLSSGFWVTIVGAFIWGAAHAMSPGHGKTLVGAYLMGEKATVHHALFLGLTTTVTHTLGVFALGGVTLLASKTFLPEQLFPWMSLLSGLLVVTIGTNLLLDRLKQSQQHSHHEHHKHSEHAHHHEENHHHHHSHDDRSQAHSHLPPEKTSWKNLMALGISGGLIPCPSALLLLLSSIALGQVGYGLLLVLSFSLGLAGVLTGLGLLLISSKHLFVRLPIDNWTQASGLQSVIKLVPIGTAFAITLIGFIMSMQALSQIGMIKLS